MRAAILAFVLLLLVLNNAGAANFSDASAAFHAKRYAEAIEPLTTMANAGDHRAQFLLARMYNEALGVPRNMDAAIVWFRRAAEGLLAESEQMREEIEVRDETIRTLYHQIGDLNEILNRIANQLGDRQGPALAR